MTALHTSTSLSALRMATVDVLGAHLEQQYDVTIREENLDGLMGFMITSPFHRHRALSIAADTTDAEKIYLLLHIAAHVLLGHAARPFATFLEPRVAGAHGTLTSNNRRHEEHKQADMLAHAVLLGCDDRTWSWFVRTSGIEHEPFRDALRQQARDICVLLPGYYTAALWRVVSLSFVRQMVILGLNVGRRLYHLSKLREMDDVRIALSPVRRIYWRTEMVESTPRLA